MDKHHGKVVEYVVRKNGYNISELATEMFVNRRSIYNWFNQQNLRSDIIYRIGCVLRHDFSKEFPELFNSNEFKVIYEPRRSQVSYINPEENWKDKYLTLLEKYNTTLDRKKAFASELSSIAQGSIQLDKSK